LDADCNNVWPTGSCIVHATFISDATHGEYGSVHICFQRLGGFRQMSAHDEFSGAQKVSLLDRAVMTIGLDRLRRTAAPRAIGLCATLLIAASPATAADDASRWDGDARSAIRLIAGSSPAGKTAPLRAGIEIRLKPGWHTYWRYPGGRRRAAALRLWGIAEPQGGRGHVARAAAHPGGEPGGDRVYRRHHPAACDPAAKRGEARGAASQARLCGVREVVRAAEGKGELVLAGGPSSHDTALAAAAARVPQKAALGQGSTIAIKSVRREDGAARPRIVVDVAAPSGASVALFAEGPAPDWALPVPTPIEGAPAGLQRFAFELDGAPPGAKYNGAAVTLTAVAGDAAIEVATHLD
jgi:DsbC/DsbD-like thiol-disulfide interchange protein